MISRTLRQVFSSPIDVPPNFSTRINQIIMEIFEPKIGNMGASPKMVSRFRNVHMPPIAKEFFILPIESDLRIFLF
jgi:hypothetical protein